MTVRIATHNAYDRGLSHLQQRQTELARLQEQLTTGKRVARASDDPAAAARAERALATETRLQAEQRALDASRNLMTQADSALADGGELLQQARELVVAAGNASYSDKERASLAHDLRALRAQLLGVVNRGDGGGAWLFGGQGSGPPPFGDEAGGVVFRGSPGQTAAAGEDALPLSLDGGTIWLQARDPVTGDHDLSVFGLMDRIADELETVGRSGAEIAQTVSDGLRDIDAAHDHLLMHRARVGQTLQRIDAVQDRVWDRTLAAQTERSAAEDLDMVQAISEFQNRQTGYDAALKAYAQVQRMSLFQYLNP